MRSDDDLLGPLCVLYLVHALPPIELTGPPLAAYECATSAANRGWTTTVVSADPSVTAWGDVRRSRELGEWFTRVAVPLTEEGTSTVPAPATGRDRKGPATRFFVEILRRTRPDLVHVIDDTHLPSDWPELAGEAGIPVVRKVTSTDEMAALYAEVVKSQPLARAKRLGTRPLLHRRR
jgi:hypothetical protein